MTWEELLRQANKEPDGGTVRKKPTHKEDHLQIQCMRWLQYQHPDIYDLTIHVPNGGARSKVEGSIFKAMGVKAGFPDIFVFKPNHFPDTGKMVHGLAIEMKTTDRGSRQRDTQKQWQQRLESVGYLYRIARTLEEFQQIIKDYIKHDQEP